MSGMGRTIVALGVLLVVIGLVVMAGDRLPIRLGRLPGDIVYRGKNSTFYFPLMTCILISVMLSVVLWLINRFR